MLVFIWGIFAYFSPSVFLKSDIYLSFLPNIAIILILSLGLLPIIISGEFDMSFPAILAMGGYVFAITQNFTNSITIGMVATILVGLIAGLINGMLVMLVKIPSIITTIGTGFLYRGIVMILCGGLSITLNDLWANKIFIANIKGISISFIWAIFLSIVEFIILFKTSLGEGVMFVGDNKSVAKMLGFNEIKIKILLFVISGILSAFAGALLSLEFLNFTPTAGEGYMLLVFASIFIGGTSATGGNGTIYGTIIGCIIMSILESGIVSIGLDSFYTRSIQGLIVLLSVGLYSVLKNKF